MKSRWTYSRAVDDTRRYYRNKDAATLTRRLGFMIIRALVVDDILSQQQKYSTLGPVLRQQMQYMADFLIPKREYK